jgi:hypothetical protein
VGARNGSVDEIAELHEEGPQRMLEVGDRTVGVGEGCLKMSEDMRRRPMRGFGRQLGWRASPRQCRADLALALVEAFPDALQGPVTELAVGSADACDYAVGNGVLEEPPQTAGGEAEASDFVGAPDAESPSAPRTCIAIAAKNASGAHCFSQGVAVVIPAQIAVPNQRANNLAVRTRRLLEPFGNRIPFLGPAAKPLLRAHPDHTSKFVILRVRGRGGVVAGYDKKSQSGVRGKVPGGAILCRIPGVTNILQSDANSATFAPECDQSEVRDR